MSTLMTSTMDNMQKAMDQINAKGLRDKVKIIIGGAPITPDFAEEIGADFTTTDSMEAATWAMEQANALDEGRW